MHIDFADWYRICTTGTETNLTAELLTSRWKGIEKLTHAPQILELVRATLQRPSVDGEYLGRFRDAFKEADVTFRMSGNDLELSVLAGSLLSEIFLQGAPGADQGSIGLLCAVGIGVNRPHCIGPFIHNAETYLDRRLRTLRKQREAPSQTFSPRNLKPYVDTYVARLLENQPAQNSEAAKALFEVLVNSLSAITEATANELAELRRQSELRKEETDVLSWLTAGVSRDAGVTFAELKAPAASLMAGKELADLIRPPGILAARSLLQGIIPPTKGKLQAIIPPAKAKAADKDVTLLAAINATDRSWREGVMQAFTVDPIADLCPALGAVNASLTTDEADGWVAAYKKSYGIDPNTPVQPIDLSYQIHLECLLTKIG